MQTNNKNKTISITREHDKLCILENLINKDFKLEKLISDFIDHVINRDKIKKLVSVNCLKDYLKDFNLLSKIIRLSCSIANGTPYEMLIPNNGKIDNITTYLNKPYISFLPNDYFPASF